MWVESSGPCGRGRARAEAGPWAGVQHRGPVGTLQALLAAVRWVRKSSHLPDLICKAGPQLRPYYPAGRGAQASGLDGCVWEGELSGAPVGGVRTAGNTCGSGLYKLKAARAIHCIRRDIVSTCRCKPPEPPSGHWVNCEPLQLGEGHPFPNSVK